MEFYGNLKNQLVRRADTEMKRFNTAIEETDIDNDDVNFFELSQRQRLSQYAVHEQIRSRHTLLKTAIDNVQ